MISFDKHPGVSLDKGVTSEGICVKLDHKASCIIRARLRWRSNVGIGGSDLDLFAWVVGEGTKGRKGGLRGLIGGMSNEIAEVIYHKNLGSLHRAPYVQHSGDRRIPGMETVRVGSLDKVRYVLFGVYQASGSDTNRGPFRYFDADLMVADTEGKNKFRIDLTESHPNRYWAAIALIDLTP